MDNIVFSVIIPVYNIEQYLPECLGSCMAQDIREAEFICVDDGSPDDSVRIINEYMLRDSRFRLVRKENGGLSSARNAGMAESQGDWIVFLDGDDRLKEDALAWLLARVRSGEQAGAPWDIIVFGADIFPDNIDENAWFKKTLQFEGSEYNEFRPEALFNERGAMPFVWRHAYSARLIRESGVQFDESLKYGEDVIFPMSVFPEAGRILFAEDCLYDYRVNRAGSMTEDMYAEADRVVIQHLEIIRHAGAYWEQKGWIRKYGADFLKWAMKFTLLKVRELPADTRKRRADDMREIIYALGLEKYRRSLDIKGKLMWLAYSMYWRR